MLVFGLVQLVAFGSMLFLPAGTFDYWQAWLFLAALTLSTWISGVYLLRKHPAALQRRMGGGPIRESRTVQKFIMGGVWLSLAAMVVVSALDHRCGWSSVPTAVCLGGYALVAAGLVVAMLVVIQNSYAAATVQVEAGQQVISTGLYGLVRHPMYAGYVIMMAGIPFALGSYVGLVFVVPGFIALTLRIRDEEKLLQEKLDGYREYTQQVRYRLVPWIW
ncbi:isoprenylcysteine carboxylmethyltransferase family protein [Mycobacterium branderi]|nr:isoprenylcysteine carboxylmethyltransferase family protein [Mycobacterium branderi]